MVDEGQAVYNLNSEEVETWLLMLFGDTAGLVHVSASRDWAGQAYPISEIDKLVEYVRAHDDREGTYVRMTTLRAQPKDGGRGSEAFSIPLIQVNFRGRRNSSASGEQLTKGPKCPSP